MTKNVYLTITGTQSDGEGQETVTELKIPGQYYERDGCRYLLYEEKDSETEAVTKSTLKIRDSLLELSRSGPVRSRMVFCAGTTHRTSYITPYGILQLEICTESLRIFWSEDSGTIQINYCLTAENAFLSENRLSIKIAAVQP